jgi:hypothetical protein
MESKPEPANALTQTERLGILMHEYDAISSQIIHWDQHLWTQSQFFVAIESIFVALIGKQLIDGAVAGASLPVLVTIVLTVGTLLNIYLCYVWFRVGRRNLEYSGVRYARAKDLEAAPDVVGVLALYRLETATLTKRSMAKHGSRRWVMHIPSAFILTWLAVLAVVGYQAGGFPEAAIPLLTGLGTSVVITSFELGARTKDRMDATS